MTPNKEWFTSYKSGSFGTIHLGDDKLCAITGIGTIKIQLHDGVVRTLNDVRHIPDMRKNLIFLAHYMLMVLIIDLMMIGKSLE